MTLKSFADMPSDFVDRCQDLDRRRFDGRATYRVGDVLTPSSGPLPWVEDAFRIDGRKDTRDSRDPDFDLIGPDHPLVIPHWAWFVVRVECPAGMPERSRKFINRCGFRAYWPRSMREVLRGNGARKHKRVLVSSVFGSYILAHIPAIGTPYGHDDAIGAPWGGGFGQLRSHEARFHGVYDFLRTALGPVALDDCLVERLVNRERSGEFNSTEMVRGKRVGKREGWCQPGRVVRVCSGPFAMFHAVVEELDFAKSRIKVGVSIFGRATPLNLELAQVEAV